MTKRPHRTSTATVAVLAIALAFSPSARGGNQDDQGNDDSGSKIQRGLAIAPVPVKLAGKNARCPGCGQAIRIPQPGAGHG